jgi:hypothetical protein
MRLDDHDRVPGVHLPRVHERERELVLVNAVRRDVAPGDLAEEAIASHAPVVPIARGRSRGTNHEKCVGRPVDSRQRVPC